MDSKVWTEVVDLVKKVAINGWARITKALAVYDVELSALGAQELDDLAAISEVKSAVAADVIRTVESAQVYVDYLKAYDDYVAALALLNLAIDSANPLARLCVRVDGADIVVQPAAVVKGVLRTAGTKATAGESVVGRGRGNSGNVWEVGRWYIGPVTREKVAGTRFYVNADGTATVVLEDERFDITLPMAADGTADIAKLANALVRYGILRLRKYNYFKGLAVPVVRENGQTLADYVKYLMGFSHVGVDATSEYNAGDIVKEIETA